MGKRCNVLVTWGVAMIAVLVAALPGNAGSGAQLAEVVATLEQGYRHLTDLQADFAQRTSIASVKREEKGFGELFMKRTTNGTAMFRFNYTKPHQQIIANGKKVWYYLPDNRQVMVTDMAALFEGGNSVALNYLTGLGNVSSDFTVAFAGDGRDPRGNYVLELVPKKPSQALAKLRLTISAKAVDGLRDSGAVREPFPILSSVVYDQLGNTTSIEYSRVKVNHGMATEQFTFKIPKGVEVIKP